MQIDRNKLAEEMLLRKYIQKAIKVVKERRERESLSEEEKLRKIVRSLIKEAKADVKRWPTYGMNVLDLSLIHI